MPQGSRAKLPLVLVVVSAPIALFFGWTLLERRRDLSERGAAPAQALCSLYIPLNYRGEVNRGNYIE